VLGTNDSLPSGFAAALVEAARRASVGVVVAVDRGGGFRCEFANERAVGLLGRDPQGVPEDLGLDEDTRQEVRRWLSAGGSAPLAVDAVVAGGSRDAPSRIVASRTVIDGRATAVFFFYDSLVRRHAERALARSEARFRTLLDITPEAIALGTRSRFLYANPACVRLLGYAAMDEVTRIPLREHLHADDRPTARRLVNEVLGTGAPPPPARMRVQRKDGDSVEVELRVVAVEWDGERALLGIARDLTERRRGHAQLIRADRLASMGTLAAGVAHEINNPLAYLMLNLQYLMRELPKFDGDEARLGGFLERLAEAEHGARRVSAIVADLLTLGGPGEVAHGRVSVPEAIAAAVKSVSAELGQRARVVQECADVPLVKGSAARLEQVFVNLLSNAAQAMPAGAPRDGEIRIRAVAEGDSVVVEVSDTGEGVAPEALGRIFDPFFTTKPHGFGTGLGLPISRSIVKSLGGEITVRSTLGRGTTFSVVLPALPREEAGLPGGEPARRPDFGALAPVRLRVLIVDDEALVAGVLARTLGGAHDVQVATDGHMALDSILSGAEFDLIFCDLLMPRMTGMDLYDALHATRPGVEERIVFMTGGAFTERAARFLATVPNQKLGKPFDLAELERVILVAARSRA
jgi:PAS domain S-box-containing protein